MPSFHMWQGNPHTRSYCFVNKILYEHSNFNQKWVSKIQWNGYHGTMLLIWRPTITGLLSNGSWVPTLTPTILLNFKHINNLASWAILLFMNWLANVKTMSLSEKCLKIQCLLKRIFPPHVLPQILLCGIKSTKVHVCCLQLHYKTDINQQM